MSEIQNGDLLIGNGRVSMLLEKEWQVGGWGVFELWITVGQEYSVILRTSARRNLSLQTTLKCVAVDPSKLIGRFELSSSHLELTAGGIAELCLGSSELSRISPMMSFTTRDSREALLRNALACRFLEDPSILTVGNLPLSAIQTLKEALGAGQIASLSDSAVDLSKKYLLAQGEIQLMQSARSHYLEAIPGIDGRCDGVILGALIASTLSGLPKKMGRTPTSRECKLALEGIECTDFDAMNSFREQLTQLMAICANNRDVCWRTKWEDHVTQVFQGESSKLSKASSDFWQRGGLAQVIFLGVVCCLKGTDETVDFLHALSPIKRESSFTRYLVTAYVLAIRHIILTPATTPQTAEVLEVVRGYLNKWCPEMAHLLSEDSFDSGAVFSEKSTGDTYDFVIAFFHFSNRLTFHQGMYESLRREDSTLNAVCLLGGLLGGVHSASGIPKKLRLLISAIETPGNNGSGTSPSEGLFEYVRRFMETLHESNLSQWKSADKLNVPQTGR